jgi:chromosome segregation ATPase
MQLRAVLVFLSLCAPAASAADADSNPLGTVIALMDSLTAKVEAEGVAEDKAFTTYKEWCDETTQNQRFDIDTSNTKNKELEATIDKASADIEASISKIEDLAGKIGQADTDLKDATLVREKEQADFVAAEAELSETLSALTRAIGIIEKEMAKNPAAFMQMDVSSIQGLVGALSAIADAASLKGADTKQLVVFAQQSAEDEDSAPDPASYKSHSRGILDVLEDLKAKAEEQLAELRKAESNAKQNYALLKQSLEDEMAYNTKEKGDEEAFKSDAEETKATATGDLSASTKMLEDTQSALSTTQADCVKTASDHDASTASRAQELKVIAEAKKVLMQTSSGAVDQTYSFVQKRAEARRSLLHTRADLKSAEIVHFMKKLAQKEHSEALSQLASRVSALMQYGASAGEDPFVKVKGLIRDMIAKLESEGAAAATEKAYCDEQLAKTEAKKSELDDDVAKLTAKIDTKAAQSAKLKEEVKELQSQLAALTKEQAEMDTVRAETHAAYTQAKSDLELGLKGVSKALSDLRKYYQGEAALVQQQQPAKPVFHSKASGAGGSIIDILEVVMSDFSKNLADEEAQESDAQASYESRTQEIKVSTAEKSQSVKYKVQEFKDLDKQVNELTADRASTNEELTAVLEYYAKVKERCIAKPESYEERKARRESEIAGLKQALEILNDEVASSLLQASRKARVQGKLQAL